MKNIPCTNVRRHLFSCWLILTAILLFISDNALSEVKRCKGQTVYVPIYSHIYSGDRERPFLLAATLSIRNTDPDQSITVKAIDYYDSDGKLLKKYLQKNLTLNPMASTRVVIKESDKSGGSGANFIVKWESNKMVTAPLIESIMIGTQVQQGISFTSRGQVIIEMD
ncbi:MAG: DUF3124 domain-containing protein [Desulfobacteraceae bacterium]|nr:MAG: DUF3124 domain-containing protein [Desulfobacteraceae bacterium]